MSKPTKRKKAPPKSKKAPKKKRAKKPEPYTGGGTWHPPGMMPGGRYWGGRSSESW